MYGAGPQAAAGSKVLPRDEYLVRLSQAKQRLAQSGTPAQHSPMRRAGGLNAEFAPLAAYSSPSGGPAVAMQPLAHVPHGGGLAAQGGLPQSGGPPKAARQVKDNFVNRVVERCGPAVVRVETEQKVELPGADADIFSFFFGVRPDAARRQERRVQGHGSGYCIDGAGGVIVTNAHVVQAADRVTVSFPGKSTPLECEVLEADEVIDVAVIRTREKPKARLPEVSLGSSESLRTGDWAVVLGHPLGLRNTCTLGIVSSLDRSTGETGFDWMRHPLLQTDAAVNQGNSGGPLLNELGEVVGMISMRALFGEGIGFAIPSDSLKPALSSLLQRKKVPRAYLGLKMTAQSDDGRRRRDGVFVETVLPQSPARAAGFEVDDEIVEADGRRVHHFEEVQALVRSARVGQQISFVVRRGDKRVPLSVAAADVRELRKNSEGNGGRGGRRVVIIP